MTERYKTWVDEVSELFGGLEICALEIIVGKDGKEHIIEVNDSALTLMGDSQEEDRRHIAELVTHRMQNMCRPAISKATSKSSVTSQSTLGSPGEESRGVLSSLSSLTHSTRSEEPPSSDSGHATMSTVGRRDSQGKA